MPVLPKTFDTLVSDCSVVRSGRLRGFTLIEFLVVAAVVGILVTIMATAVDRVRHKGRTAEAATNLRQLVTAFMIYSNDHGGALPFTYHYIDGNWKVSLVQGGYLGSPDKPNPNLAWWDAGEQYSMLGSPVQWHERPGLPKNTFSMNSTAVSHQSQQVQHAQTFITDFLQPSRTLLVGEGTLNDGGTGYRLEMWAGKLPDNTGEDVRMAFMDGHVSTLQVKDIPRTAGSAHSGQWYFWRGR